MTSGVQKVNNAQPLNYERKKQQNIFNSLDAHTDQ